MKTSIRSLVLCISVWTLLILSQGIALSQQASQNMIDQEEKRLEMQIKDLENQRLRIKIGDTASNDRYNHSIERVRDRLRLLHDDPDQYFYNRQAQQQSGGYRPQPAAPPPPEASPPPRALHGKDGIYFPDGGGGYIGPDGKRLR
jgi:hypothetical protein